MWPLLSLKVDESIVSIGMSVKILNNTTNSIGPDETTRNEPSHLSLHCFQKFLLRFTEKRELMQKYKNIGKLCKVRIRANMFFGRRIF